MYNKLLTIKNIVLSVIALMVYTGSAYAQNGLPFYSDYLSDNQSLVFPSMAGISYTGKVRITARGNWFTVKDAPLLQTFNTSIRIKKSPIGVGFSGYNDRNGFHSRYGGRLSYAYHLRLSNRNIDTRVLSFGMSTGMYRIELNETSFFFNTVSDPNIQGNYHGANSFNVDAAISYFRGEFYIHALIQNLYVGGQNIYLTEDLNTHKKIIINSGYNFKIKKTLVQPSILFYSSEVSQRNFFDYNFKVYHTLKRAKYYNKEDSLFWYGISYRKGIGEGLSEQINLFTPFIGINTGRYMFGYNYTHSVINQTLGGFHQISFGFDFWKSNEPYKCKCPGLK